MITDDVYKVPSTMHKIINKDQLVMTAVAMAALADYQ